MSNEKQFLTAKKHAFVCCPFDMMMSGLVEKIINSGINPEIGLNGSIPYQFKMKDFVETAKRLKKAELNTTIHAPFSDLVIGASDIKLRQVAIERIKFAIDFAVIFEARSVVLHSGFDSWHHEKESWLERTINSMEELVGYASASEMPLMLENVYEPDPEIHREIFNRIESPFLGFCLDAGHATVFSKTAPIDWLKGVGDRLGHMHIHDNMGKQDDHLPPGSGVIEFDTIFSWVSNHRKQPILTVEPHKEEFVFPSLTSLGNFIFKYNLLS